MTRKNHRNVPATATFPAVILTILALACLIPARSAGQGSTPLWAQQAELAPSDTGGYFGQSVSIDGSVAVVGAPTATIGGKYGQGAAYIFVNNGGVWTQQAELTAADGAYEDMFGWSVSISGDTVVVGACDHANSGTGYQGAAYVYVNNGGSWTQAAELVAPDGDADAHFGWSVSVSGDTAVVGAPVKTVAGSEQGAAYVFSDAGGSWTEQTEFVANDGHRADEFGAAVAVDGANILVGAPYKQVNSNFEQGVVYVFTQSGSTWSQYTELIAPDGVSGSGFGSSIALSGSTALIGAPNNIGDTAGAGSVYVYQLDFGTWSGSAETAASDSAPGDSFGQSVALDSETGRFLVGAPRKIVNSSNVGATYAFALIGGVFASQQSELTASDATAGDQFGSSVALSGTTAIVGAEHQLANATQGEAYVFTESPTQLQIVSEPAVGTVASAINAVMIQLEDASGNPLTTSGVAVTIASSPAGVSGTLTVNSVDGIAEFDGLTFPSANTYTLTASSTGLTSATGEPIQISQVAQSIIFGALPNQTLGAAPFAVTATASSGLPVSLTSLTGAVCSVSGNTVTLAKSGQCTIQASQAGNAEYSAAAPVNRSFEVTKSSGKLSPQHIVFYPIPDQVWGSAPITVVATTTSGLVPDYNSLTPKVCSNTAARVTLLKPGTCAIQATQPGDASYAPADPVIQTFTIAQASQVITFKEILQKDIAIRFTVDPKASSKLPVTLTSSTPDVCTIGELGSVVLHHRGTCTLTATQPGNAYYLPAPPVTQSFQVIKRIQVINFPPIPNQWLNPNLLAVQTVDLNATTNSGLEVQYNTLTPSVCRILHISVKGKPEQTEVTLRKPGVCNIEVSAFGDARYYPVLPVQHSFTIE